MEVLDRVNKKNIQLIITGVLALVLIAVFINSTRAVSKKNEILKSYADLKIGSPAPQVVQPSADKLKNKIEENLSSVIGRDPFKRQSVAEDMSVDYKKRKVDGIAGILLTGIIYDQRTPGDNFCIINGEDARVKDKIGDFVIMNIKENQVTLVNDKEQKEYNLKLWEDQ